MAAQTPHKPLRSMSYHERASLPNTHPLTAQLLQIMASKRTNLCLSADIPSLSALHTLIEQTGPHICLLKLHADAIDDFSHAAALALLPLAQKHQFLIFEDRKFGDIGSTVQRQYTAGPLRIADWADVVNAHIFPGPAVVRTLEAAVSGGAAYEGKSRALLLLAEMSSEGNLMDSAYAAKCLEVARAHRGFVMGFVAQRSLNEETEGDAFLTMTPGVSLPPEGEVLRVRVQGDGLGQQYNSPRKVVLERGSDVIIVGRGIVRAADPQKEAARYQAEGWAAYLERIGFEPKEQEKG